MKTVSVVIPNYNNAHFLKGAVESVLAQTFQDFEIIVVDDGSTDNSQEVVASFGDKVQYVFQENKGLGGARNTGILASGASFVGLLDADDEWLPTYLETMIELAQRYPLGDVYFCAAQSIDPQGNDLPQVFGGAPWSPSYIPREKIYERLLRANFLIPSTVLIRCSLFKSIGLFEQSIREIHGCEDWDMWLRTVPKHDFVGTPKCLVRYRIHTNALSANPGNMQRAAQAVMERHFGIDDGNIATWSSEKRRAYGGVYRYYLLTSVQRQNDWQGASQYFRKALEIDPMLAGDLDMFYELALGVQPNGYRGTAQNLDLRQNVASLNEMLTDVFSTARPSELSSLRNLVYGTANYAMGLVAYNAGYRRFCRHFFLKALFFRPALWLNRRLFGNLFKSFLGNSFFGRLKLFILKIKGGNSIHEHSV